MIEFRESAGELREGKYLPAYLLLGTENLLMERWLSLLLKKFGGGEDSTAGLRRVEGGEPSLREIIAELAMPDLFSGGKKIVLIDDFPFLSPPPRDKKKLGDEEGKQKETSRDEEQAKEALTAFWNQQKSLEEPDNIIIFRAAETDKRKGFFKLLNKLKAVVDCSPLRGEALRRWVNARLRDYGKTIEGTALENLLLITGGDLRRIENEILKIGNYMQDNEEVITEDIIENLVYSGPRGNIFKMCDALGEGSVPAAFRHLNDLLALREPPLMILQMAVRQFRLILKALCLREEGVSASSAASALGVPPFVASKIFRQSGTYSRSDLREIMRLIQETDLNIKTGMMEPGTALEMLFSRIFSFLPGK